MSNTITHRESFLPKSEQEELQIIVDIYRERINADISQHEVEALGEYYRTVKGRKLDAFEWMVEAVTVVSKKETGKRNIPYISGMIRNWLVYGFGYIPTKEEEMVAKFIEEDFGITLNRHARNILQELIGKYGSINLTRVVTREGQDIDLSVGIMLAIKNHLEYITGGRTHDGEESGSEKQFAHGNRH